MKVQRESRSLLALLGVVGDQSPAIASDMIMPTIDVAYLLTQSSFALVESSDAAAVMGGAVTNQVPGNEYWQLIAASGVIIGAAGMTTAALGIQLLPEGGTAGVGLAYAQYVDATALGTAGSVHRVTFQPSRPVILSPGMRVRVRLDLLTGVANALVIANVALNRLPT